MSLAIKAATLLRVSSFTLSNPQRNAHPRLVMYSACMRVWNGLWSLFNTRFLHQGRNRKITIAVEGNIGSGKTTLLQHFLNSPNTEVHQEPVAKWRDIDGHNALALMYEDPSRWSLTFQTYVQLTMLQTHTKPRTEPVKLMERSIYSAKYCFVENLHDRGTMPDIEYVVLTRWFDWIVANEDVKLDLIIYLRTQPETVHERIKKRCRKEEEAIPLSYLQSLHDLHEDWLIHEKFPLPAPVMVLDGNYDVPEMRKIYDANQKDILCGYA